MALITPNPTTQLLQQSLQPLGYTVETFEVAGSAYTRFTAPNGKVWLTQSARIGYPFTSHAVTKIAGLKDVAYEYCSMQGVRVPKTMTFNKDYTDAELEAALRHAPLVVKPHDASLSWGVTLAIEDKQTLRTAIKLALTYSPTVLVQEQVEGEELRFTVVDGVVRAAILRARPRVIGDGSSSIIQLLAKENAERAALDMPYVTYPQLDPERIQLANHQSEDILPKGEVLLLGRNTMIRDGASIYNVLSSVHASYLKTVVELVIKLGARFIVVDMMLHDYTKPQSDNNYAFIEFNTAPVLKLFYSCRDGNHYDILGDLVPMIDATLTGQNHA